MPTYEKLKGAVALASNSPGMPTGYGNQAQLLLERMVRHGLEVASLSNYGIEGRPGTLEVGKKTIPHYHRGLDLYSLDVIPLHMRDFKAKNPDRDTVLFTLYDVWVYNNLQYDEQIVSWVPMDHITPPPNVIRFLKKENVTPIAMAPHGQRQMESQGIESVYIPHGVDTKLYYPNLSMKGTDFRDVMGLKDSDYLVGMVAANKANGSIHRKAFAENLLAFSLHLKKYPDSYLYIHSEPTKVYGGFDLATILKMVGIPKNNVFLPDLYELRTGFDHEYMRAMYSSLDVLLSTSYGEGFGIPTVEAQACGTRVITSNFSASADLASEDSWKIDGQPFWDEAQASFYSIPSVNGIVRALEDSYLNARGHSAAAVQFASDFDVEKVWTWRWLPFLKGLFK
jgi:glycosyltransferase involved in cell wall biosynthesis